MKIWVINNFNLLIWVFSLILFSIFKFTFSDSSPLYPSTSLVQRHRDLLPSTRHDAVLVATLDGTISLVEIESRKILWSVKTGLPIYSSYQASQNLDVNLENASEIGDDTYIDCGDDWNLYKHDRGKGIIERLKSAKDLIRETKLLSKNGSAVIGQLATTVIVVDANTGSVLRTLRFSGFSDLGPEDGENPILVREPSKEQIFITRTDYSFLAYSKISGKVLWNVTLAEFEAESFSSEAESSIVNTNRDQLGSVYKGHPKISTSCQRRTMVYRLRDRGFSELISGGMFNEMSRSLPGSRLRLPDPEHMHPSLPFAYRDQKPVLALPLSETNGYVHSLEMLALPSSEIPAANHRGTSMHPGSSVAHLLWSPIISGVLLLFAVCYSIYRCVFLRGKKQGEDSKSKVMMAKRKKPKKSGNRKNNSTANNTEGSISKADDSILAELPYLDKNSQSSLTGVVNAKMDGRNIGKLWVSPNEIAKGSNGTVVFEGIYDGRPVAVKRLVLTHHNVASKEIESLMASDHHPNIVRLCGVDYDSDFAYLSLERCLCSLNDLIYFCSISSQNATNPKVVDSCSPNSYTVQLPDEIVAEKDLELWKSNGYPSPQLLKLMRDVVSGIAHLHELGFIHRDLKPQNVLILKDRVFYAKLSDMGISKRLVGDVSSLTQHATGAGSSGWRSPEQILHGRQTRAVDLFSLGCILFFCMTGGKHPFGDIFERDANIVKNRKDLFLLEHVPEAVDLINRLLDPNPELRPKAIDVLDHPLFWTSEKRLSFLRDASDRVELEDRETSSDLLKALEATATTTLGAKWNEKLEPSLLTDMNRYRRYKYDSIRDLLRLIRNKLNHYRELRPELQEVLGSLPQGFDNYFIVRFPKLLIEVYRVIQEYCQEEDLLCKYFKSSLL